MYFFLRYYKNNLRVLLEQKQSYPSCSEHSVEPRKVFLFVLIYFRQKYWTDINLFIKHDCCFFSPWKKYEKYKKYALENILRNSEISY